MASDASLARAIFWFGPARFARPIRAGRLQLRAEHGRAWWSPVGTVDDAEPSRVPIAAAPARYVGLVGACAFTRAAPAQILRPSRLSASSGFRAGRCGVVRSRQVRPQMCEFLPAAPLPPLRTRTQPPSQHHHATPCPAHPGPPGPTRDPRGTVKFSSLIFGRNNIALMHHWVGVDSTCR